jgi:hypothetical protein
MTKSSLAKSSRKHKRRERRQYEAQLRALADSGIELSQIGHVEGSMTCDCTGCQLIRAGMCLSCAARVTAEIIKRDEQIERRGSVNITVELCSGACSEALQQVFEGAKRAKNPKSEILPISGQDTSHSCAFECVPSSKKPREIYIVFDGQRIAKRGVRLATGEPGWISLIEGYEVEDVTADQFVIYFHGERQN